MFSIFLIFNLIFLPASCFPVVFELDRTGQEQDRMQESMTTGLQDDIPTLKINRPTRASSVGSRAFDAVKIKVVVTGVCV